MKRILFALFAGGMSLVLVAALVAWIGLRASLPQLDGAVTLAGIDAPATIQRDDQGIPTITASSREDLAFATGFAHAQDRLFQMDLIRRQAAGELAELFGERAVDADKRLRFHRFRARAQRVFADMPDDEKAIIEAYAAGVNECMAMLKGKPFEYYLLGVEVAPWQVEDTLLVVYAMFLTLNDADASNEVRRGLVHRVLPEELYHWMYAPGTSWDAPIQGQAFETPAIPGEDVISLRSQALNAPPSRESGRIPLRGSNNWAVSGALTSNGRALVSNDMHLGLNVPNIYYQARLLVKGSDAREIIGVTLPGAPFVVAGSNTRVAWGYTNSYGDWVDAVLLQPGSEAGTYRTPGGERSFESHIETIEVKDGDPVELIIRETIWGPVLDDLEYPDGDIAVSWIAHARDGINLRLLDLETAASLEEALDIANRLAMPPQNFVAGDAAGNIGWTIAGKIPQKSEFDAMLPADWSEQQGWTGWLAADDYPRIVNPESGRIWTANTRVVDGDALRLIGDGGYDLGARAAQIRDALMAKEMFTADDMLAIQYDDRALFLARWRELLLQQLSTPAAGNDAELAEYRRLVDEWLPRAAPESVGYRLVRAFRLEVQNRLFHALTEPARDAYGDAVSLRRSNQFEGALWSLVSEQPEHMLPANFADWNEFFLAAVRENIRYFAASSAAPLSERRWGELNSASIRHPLSSALPMVSKYLDMPQTELNGDLDMPKAQGSTFGASQRFSVMPGDEANSLMHMPAGQSGHPLSDFYSAGHDDWVRGKPSPFLPGMTTHTLTLQPSAR
ncbi:MAG: penicillin acylase family protein [Woeseiaceae bacterium]